jgi:hypothetical protein
LGKSMNVLDTILDDRWRDTLRVVLPNSAALAAVNLVSVGSAVQLCVGLVTISYTVWRWRRDSYVTCRACIDGRPPFVCPLPPHRRPRWCPKNL